MKTVNFDVSKKPPKLIGYHSNVSSTTAEIISVAVEQGILVRLITTLTPVHRPTKHIIGHIEDGFYGSKDPTKQCQCTGGREVIRTRLKSH